MEYKSENVICQNCKNDFTIEPDDFSFYEKMKVPPPTFCPECRFMRRLTFMNVYSLYKRKCDKCDENIVSMFHKDKDIIVYCSKCWWADDWDGTEYAVDYNPNINFLEQWFELMKKTPHMALDTLYSSLVNTNFTNYSSYLKNSYGLFYADYAEDSAYCDFLNTINNCLDCYRIRESELCYESVGLYKCFGCKYSLECENSTSLYFSKNCSGCTDCFGCVNLRNKSYCIFNEQYSKEDYFSFIKNIDFSSHKQIEEFKKKAKDFWDQNPNREYYGNGLNVNVYGEYVYESRNAHDVYMGTSIENGKFVQFISVATTKDAYDYTCWGGNAEKIYDTLIAGHGASDVKFSVATYPEILEASYCYYVSTAKYVFGCANLKRKNYCILNKEYSKEEYEVLKKQIIEDMNKNPYVDNKGRVYKYGEFFPIEFSPFGFNETLALQYFNKSKEEINASGFIYFESEKNIYEHNITSSELPDKREDLPDLDNKVILCECGKCYKIVEIEKMLLAKINAPIPRSCPECRRQYRHKITNSFKKNKSNCAKCNKEIEHHYNLEKENIIYCKKCYQQEVY